MERTVTPPRSAHDRYKHEDGRTVVEVAVKSARQLFSERDPAPFRDRDLDENFADFVLSAVQEFSLKTSMKLRIIISEQPEQTIDKTDILDAIKTYFAYEAMLTQAKLRNQLRTARLFLFAGLILLFLFLGLAHFVRNLTVGMPLAATLAEGLVIIGWVAMWRPLESVLYDWYPLRERRMYLEKIVGLDVQITSGGSASTHK